ncbi:hypothetical protein [Mycobacterium sp.]|uniref:hypothetical protein n=1 Tax=Mycobacterium sp. TaxID=1785 RepID=UPI003F95324E
MPFTPHQGAPHFGAQLEEDVKPISPVVFIEAGEEQELSMAGKVIKEATENPAAPLKVKVNAPYRVVHEGKGYTDGDVLEIPDDAEHKIWLQSGWVTKEK